MERGDDLGGRASLPQVPVLAPGQRIPARLRVRIGEVKSQQDSLRRVIEGTGVRLKHNRSPCAHENTPSGILRRKDANDRD